MSENNAQNPPPLPSSLPDEAQQPTGEPDEAQQPTGEPDENVDADVVAPPPVIPDNPKEQDGLDLNRLTPQEDSKQNVAHLPIDLNSLPPPEESEYSSVYFLVRGNSSNMTRKECNGGSSSQPEGETKVLSRRKRSLRLGPPPGFPAKCYWRKEFSETWKKNLLISLTKGNDAKRKCHRGKEIEFENSSKVATKEKNGGSSSQPESGSIRYDVGGSSRKIESKVAKIISISEKMLVELKASVRSEDDEGSSFRESKPEFVKHISMFEKNLAELKEAVEDEDIT